MPHYDNIGSNLNCFTDISSPNDHWDKDEENWIPHYDEQMNIFEQEVHSQN